jgi:hypothetical protein
MNGVLGFNDRWVHLISDAVLRGHLEETLNRVVTPARIVRRSESVHNVDGTPGRPQRTPRGSALRTGVLRLQSTRRIVFPRPSGGIPSKGECPLPSLGAMSYSRLPTSAGALPVKVKGREEKTLRARKPLVPWSLVCHVSQPRGALVPPRAT